MNQASASAGSASPGKSGIDPKQVIKWTVYSLLLINWGVYIREDWVNAEHTLRLGGSVLEWASAFTTSLDLAAWFGLLFLWELETYALSDTADTPLIRWVFLIIRGICYVFLAHTVVARAITVEDLRHIQADPGISNLCQLADQEISYAYNVEYTLIDSQNCSSLATGDKFYQIESTAVTDESGYNVERLSTWIDLQDAITWLLVMATIEIAIWLQERNITGGPAMLVSRAGKAFYALLFAHAVYWIYMGHELYAWDQVLWIGGFFAIELNVKDWRKDINKLLGMAPKKA